MKKEKILKIVIIIFIILLITFTLILVINKKNDSNKVFDINSAIEIVKEEYNILDNTVTYEEEENAYIIYAQDKDKNNKMFEVDKNTKTIIEMNVITEVVESVKTG